MEACGIRKGSLRENKRSAIMADIKWIKISCDFFNDEAIKIIEKMPEGDSIIIIWLKLLISAGKVNDKGYIYFRKEIPYTDEMLATVFDRPLNLIRLALKTFVSFGMIQITDTYGIFISNWDKYQNLGGMERVRELAKMRKRKQRSKEKMLLLEAQKINNDVTLRDCHVTVTPLEIDKDIDIDIDIEKELDKEINKEEKKKNFVAKSFFQKLIAEDEDLKEYSSLKDLFIEFLEYKTAIKKQFKTEKSVRNAFLDFIRLSGGDEKYARALVDNTIARGWQGIYDLSVEQKKAFKNTQNQNQSDDWESRCM